MPSGIGRTEYNDGDKDEGQYVNGKRHGNIKFFPNQEGIIFECTWKNGKEDGISKQTWPDGTVAYNVFKDGKQKHMCKVIHPNGVVQYIELTDD